MLYKSKYSDREIVGHQYIVELVCSNLAAKNNQELPYNFWKDPLWTGIYIKNIKNVKSLLETYDELFLIEFIRTKKIWSLTPAWVLNQLQKDYQGFLNKQKKLQEMKPTEEVLLNPTFKQSKDIDINFLD